MLPFMQLKTSLDLYFLCVADHKYTDTDVCNGYIIHVYTVNATEFFMSTLDIKPRIRYPFLFVTTNPSKNRLAPLVMLNLLGSVCQH